MSSAADTAGGYFIRMTVWEYDLGDKGDKARKSMEL